MTFNMDSTTFTQRQAIIFISNCIHKNNFKLIEKTAIFGNFNSVKH